MFDIVALGESLIDFTPSGENSQGMALFARNPGGAPAYHGLRGNPPALQTRPRKHRPAHTAQPTPPSSCTKLYAPAAATACASAR